MEPIQGLSRLMEVLRQQMAESARRLDAPRETRGGQEAAPSRPGKPSVQELKQRVQERIRAINPDAPDRKRRAQRIFLESVLAWEFGDQLLLDSEFDRMIDGIQDMLASDPAAESKISSVLDELSRR